MLLGEDYLVQRKFFFGLMPLAKWSEAAPGIRPCSIGKPTCHNSAGYRSECGMGGEKDRLPIWATFQKAGRIGCGISCSWPMRCRCHPINLPECSQIRKECFAAKWEINRQSRDRR